MADFGRFEDLLAEISSSSPVPGGGCAAALSGCFGASLVSMVCNLSIGKKKYRGVEEEMKEVLNESEALGRELLNLSREDVGAFNEVMAALKMTGEEKNKARQEAYKKAANVPFHVAKKCLRVMELAEITSRQGNQNAVTDSGVGALMAYSGLKGAVLNVKVNLKYIEDMNFIADKGEAIEELEKRGEDSIKTIMNWIEGVVGNAYTSYSS